RTPLLCVDRPDSLSLRSTPQRGGADIEGAVTPTDAAAASARAVRPQGTAKTAAKDAPTIAAAFRITASERADEVAIRTKGDEFSITWGALQARVDSLAGGLAGLGLSPGQTMALMLSNRPEFHLCDLAAMTLGACPFSIYNTYTPEQIRYIVSDAEARIIVCEQQFLERVLEARKQLPQLEHVIVVDGEPAQGTLALADVEASGAGFDAEAAVDPALQKVRAEQRGEEVPAELAATVAAADADIFSGLRTMLGLDQAVAINVGAAATPVEVLEFFHAIGLPLAELWGMSETCGA